MRLPPSLTGEASTAATQSYGSPLTGRVVPLVTQALIQLAQKLRVIVGRDGPAWRGSLGGRRTGLPKHGVPDDHSGHRYRDQGNDQQHGDHLLLRG